MTFKIKIKLTQGAKKAQDVDTVAKIVIIDNENRVLMLKRTEDHKKFPGELDLPGGHLKENENVLNGLKREVKEETGLDIIFPAFYKKNKNIHFFHARYDSQPIKISKEHSDYGFYKKDQLDGSKKFEKIAIQILEMLENG